MNKLCELYIMYDLRCVAYDGRFFKREAFLLVYTHTHTHTHTHTPVSYTHLTLPTMAVV